MVNANLRGNRFIPKHLPVHNYSGKGTPSNTLKIKAMLKMLKAFKEVGVEVESITDEDIQGEYDVLKKFACKIRQAMLSERQDLQGITWLKLGEKEPSIKKQLTLDLEKLAFNKGIAIYACEDMWAADRLLFESFRGSTERKKSSKQTKNGTNNTDSTDSSSNSNNPASVAALPRLASVLRDCVDTSDPSIRKLFE